MEVDVGEDFFIGQEMHFGAALFGVPQDLHGADLKAFAHFELTVLRDALAKLDEMHLAFAAHAQTQPFGQGIDAAHAHAVQSARDLVAVLVELAARMQLGQGNFGGTSLGLVFVIHLDPGGNAPPVVNDADAVVTVDGDHNVITMPGQGLIDGVVHHFKDQVMQSGAITGVTDVHARAFAHSFQTFEDLDAAFAVTLIDGGSLRGI